MWIAAQHIIQGSKFCPERKLLHGRIETDHGYITHSRKPEEDSCLVEIYAYDTGQTEPTDAFVWTYGKVANISAVIAELVAKMVYRQSERKSQENT